jgi:hypothetical protein
MGQEPTRGSRTQDRNDNGDQENTERHALPDRMGGRSARKPEPPSWIPRHGNSARRPPKQLLALGKLSNKLVTTAILRRKHRVELGRKHQLESFEWLNDPVLHVGRRTVSAKQPRSGPIISVPARHGQERPESAIETIAAFPRR